MLLVYYAGPHKYLRHKHWQSVSRLTETDNWKNIHSCGGGGTEESDLLFLSPEGEPFHDYYPAILC
jgi:hypothetical protein